jgi:hypothetical protein
VGAGVARGRAFEVPSAVVAGTEFEASTAPTSRLANVSVLTAKAAVAVPRTPTTVRTERSCDFIFQIYKTGSKEGPREYPRLVQYLQKLIE